MFFNIGGAEILVIAVIALIAVGPEQLPSVMRKFGKGMAQVKSMTAGLRDEFMAAADETKDVTDPDKWFGTGGADDPVVPRGYADKQKAAELKAAAVDEPAAEKVDSVDSTNGSTEPEAAEEPKPELEVAASDASDTSDSDESTE